MYIVLFHNSNISISLYRNWKCQISLNLNFRRYSLFHSVILFLSLFQRDCFSPIYILINNEVRECFPKDREVKLTVEEKRNMQFFFNIFDFFITRVDILYRPKDLDFSSLIEISLVNTFWVSKGTRNEITTEEREAFF